MMETRDKSDDGALPNIYIAEPFASCQGTVLRLINRNHDEVHQPHMALRNDSPLCCSIHVGERSSAMSCKPPPKQDDYDKKYST